MGLCDFTRVTIDRLRAFSKRLQPIRQIMVRASQSMTKELLACSGRYGMTPEQMMATDETEEYFIR